MDEKKTTESRLDRYAIKIMSGLSAIFKLSILLYVILVFGAFIELEFTEKHCSRYSDIATVGGCDAFGSCGVTTWAGIQKTSYKPTVGQRICVEKPPFTSIFAPVTFSK